METESIHKNTLDRLFDNLVPERITDTDIRSWVDFPEREAASAFLSDKIRDFSEILKEPSRRQLPYRIKAGHDASDNEHNEFAICIAVRLLKEFNDTTAVNALMELLETCFQCEYSPIFTHCLDTIIEIAGENYELLLDKYYSYKNHPQEQGIWLEILAKSGKKDYRIRNILEEYFYIDRCATVLAIGDYGDKYFIPMLRKIVEEAAAHLVAKDLNPFQNMTRVWNRDADIYIEARTILIELESDVAAGSDIFYKLLTKFDQNMLPHINVKDSLRKRPRPTYEESHSANGGNDISERIPAEFDEELFLGCCLERITHGLPIKHDTSFIVGFFKGLCCLNIEPDLLQCVEKLLGSRDIFDDVVHYNEAQETFAALMKYCHKCFDRGRAETGIKGAHSKSGPHTKNHTELCNEIAGFLEGLRTALGDDSRNPEKSRKVYDYLTDFQTLFLNFFEESLTLAPKKPHHRESQNIDELKSVFYNLILKIALEFR